MTDADHETMNCLNRLQVTRLSGPILNLCIQAQTPTDTAKAKSAGIESMINAPTQITTKRSLLDTTPQELLKDFIGIEEADAELNKKYQLVVPPSGLGISVVVALVVVAMMLLTFVILKAEDMLGSSEAYWEFFTAEILIVLGTNAAIISLIKVLRFRKINMQL